MNEQTGFQVIADNLIPELEDEPVRRLKYKSWMTASYYYRVQKKWIKRFGYKQVRPFYRIEQKIYIHPNNVEMIKAKLQN